MNKYRRKMQLYGKPVEGVVYRVLTVCSINDDNRLVTHAALLEHGRTMPDTDWGSCPIRSSGVDGLDPFKGATFVRCVSKAPDGDDPVYVFENVKAARREPKKRAPRQIKYSFGR